MKILELYYCMIHVIELYLENLLQMNLSYLIITNRNLD
nr:MAG TPA: hypothetical protein [Bacteriophage sp.]